ncbi:MAG: replication protein RepA [Gammaproteobacteria bacterium]|nr:replication protein RepA [Gammaproteobacteria bacterium]
MPTLGNRCGHDPRAPRLYTPRGELARVRRPRIIREFQQRLERVYWSAADTLPTLAGLNARRYKRSERLEACAALLGALADFVDLVSLRIGRPAAGEAFAGVRLEDLAELAGLELRRAERAYHDLVAAGTVRTHPIARRVAPGEYRGLAAIRTLSENLFRALGLGAWLRHERRKAYRRQQQRQAVADDAAAGRAGLALEGLKALTRRPRSPREWLEATRAIQKRSKPPD